MRRISLTMICVVIAFVLTSCLGTANVQEAKSISIATKVMSCFKEKEENALKDMFCDVTKESASLVDEIHEAMEFLDGTIESYNKRITDGEQASYRDGKMIYQSFDICITEVKTDTGKEYSIRVFTYAINEEEPEKVGISEILIESEDGDKISIGEYVP